MAKSDKASGDSETTVRSSLGKQDHEDSASARNDMLSGDALVTPRMAAEQEIVKSIRVAGDAIRAILAERAIDSMAYAVFAKAQGALAMQVLDAANNIGAANGGKAQPQLLAASVQAGQLSLALAQRLAAKRNGVAVHRRVVEAQPIAAAADGGMQPTAAVDAADGDVSVKLDTEK